MKLNNNCLRDILIYCEDVLSFDEDLSWCPLYLSDFVKALPQYSQEDIAYTLILLDEAHFIESIIHKRNGGIYDISVYRLTYKGHEFLATIKPDNIWEKLQSIISTTGSISLPILQELASNYLLAFLTGQ